MLAGMLGILGGTIHTVSNAPNILSKKAVHYQVLEKELAKDIHVKLRSNDPKTRDYYSGLIQEYDDLSRDPLVRLEINRFNESVREQQNGLLYILSGALVASTGLFSIYSDNHSKCVKNPISRNLNNDNTYNNLVAIPIPSRPENYLPPFEVTGFNLDTSELEGRKIQR